MSRRPEDAVFAPPLGGTSAADHEAARRGCIVVSPMELRIRILHLENARNSLADLKHASLNLPQCGAVTSPKFVPDPS
jgi:hypothetical protein